MVILAQRWAEEFMKRNPGATIQVTGGGSGTGIAALLNNSTDIAASSRPIKAKEKKEIEEKRKAALKEIPVALDALSVFVSKDCPVNEISIQTLNSIYSGKCTNWKDLGWDDAKIIVYSRENNSGTYMYFKEHVLEGGDFTQEASYMPGTAAIVNALQKDRRGIGYGGIAYLPEGVKALKVKKDEASPAVEPTLENATNGTYPLSRYLYFYTVGEPAGLAAEFIKFVLSPAGQDVCRNVGYFPLPQKN